MKRKFKNILMIVLIVLLGIGMYFTIDQAKNSYQTSNVTTQNQSSMPSAPPDMNSSSDNSSSDNQNSATPPERPDGDNSSNSNETPKEKPSGDNSNTPPEKPSNDNATTDDSSDENTNDNNQMTSGSNSNMTPPDMNSSSDSSSSDNQNSSIPVFFYVLFAIEGLIEALLIIYLIMSRFNKKTFKETMITKDKKIIYALSTLILTAALTFAQIILTENLNSKETTDSKTKTVESSNSVEANGATVIDGEEKTLTDTYESSSADESPIVVKNGGKLTLKKTKINKKSGDSSNTENSEFYGVNSGILVQKGATAKISDSTITTSAKGSNAVFSTGEGSKIYINDSTITTTGSSSSRGLDATYGGYIKADNVKITTQGGSCATLATDRGEGTVIANNSSLETNGSGSPVIYSTGDISIDSTKGTANGSQMVVIEGKNKATVTDSNLTASGKGNRNEVDNAGVMIYQSMSGDASEGKGTFTAKDSSLSIQSSSDYYKKAPMFFITNTEAEINLENTKLSYGSNILISAKGTSEWGNSGSNGGSVTFNATNQTLEGNIEIDNISTLELNLTKSTYKGTINADNTAKSISLTLDKNSKITLTGDSYVTSLDDKDSSYSNINFNGYKLYVNGKAIN